ncbi:MAG: hypothetical protein ACYTEQ_05415, partial [Planctomycetota bacterium]
MGAWAECEQGDWLLWVAATVGVDRRKVVLAACDCAREALVHVPDGEERPRLAIEATEAWANEPTGQRDAASEAAWDAARVAAWEAASEAARAAAREAASEAASAAAWEAAWEAASEVASAAARASARAAASEAACAAA